MSRTVRQSAYASVAQKAINADNATRANTATSSSYAATASLLLGSVVSASYAATASLLLGSVVSSSYAATASVLLGSVISASYALTASYTPNALMTASVSFNTITFTKGDGSTFPITVNTGSSSPASSVTQSFRMQGTGLTIAGSSGNRFTPITVFINTATEPVTQLYTEYPITLKQLIIKTTNTQPATGNYTMALRKNGADTALLITIPSSSAASVFSASADVSLVTGDLISYRLNNAASTTSTNVTQMSLLYV